MSQVKSFLSGTLLCGAVGLCAAAVGVLGWILVSAEDASSGHEFAEAAYLLLIGIGGGFVCGALVGGLHHLFSRGELMLLGVLSSTAVASIAVMLGDFSRGSWLPVVIYAVALANGGLAVPVASGGRRWFGAS
jgi:hypothetical protein